MAVTRTAANMRNYNPRNYGGVGDLSSYVVYELRSVSDIFNESREVIRSNDTVYTPLTSAANDTAAAAAGVPLYGLYHTSGTVKVRLV